MASAAEVLRHRDIAELSGAQKAALAAMFAALHPRAPLRRAHRRTAWRRGEVDAHRTLRTTLRRMGEPGPVAWRRRGTRPRRVVLLVDVSGSMSEYADALLRLAHRFVATTGGRGGVEVFTLGTRLTHVTRALRIRDPERALVAAGETVPDWSGGTRLGETLQGLPRPLGPARHGPRRRGRGVQRRLGARRPDAAGRADGPAAPDRPPRGVGQPAPRQGRLPAGAGRAWSPRCRTSTTSSPATRWRPSRSWWRWSARA